MKCANCQRDALYSYPVSGTYVLHYCQFHLPGFLTKQKNAGLLPLLTPVVPESSSSKSSKKTDTPAEEPSMEDAPKDQ